MTRLLLFLVAAPAVLAVSLSMVPGLHVPIIEGLPMSTMETGATITSTSTSGEPVGTFPGGVGLDITKIADVLSKEPASAKGADPGMDGIDIDCDDPPMEGELGAGAPGAVGAAGAEALPPPVGGGQIVRSAAPISDMSEEAVEAPPAPVVAANVAMEGGEMPGEEMAAGGEEAAPANPLAHIPGLDDSVPTLEGLLAAVRSEKAGDSNAPADPVKAARLAHQVQVLEDLIGHAKEINKLIPGKEKKLKQLKSELDSETAGARKEIAERKLAKQEALMKVVDEKLAELKERVAELEEVQSRLKDDIAATKEAAGAGGGGSGSSGAEMEGSAGAEAAFLEHAYSSLEHAQEMTSQGDSDWR